VEFVLADRAQERPSLGNYLYGAFGRDFAALDGARVCVAGISLGQWKSLVKACQLEQPLACLEKELNLDFAKEGDRYQARERIAALVQVWCSGRTFEQVSETFKSFSVCWGPYQTVREAMAKDSRVSEANAIFERVDTPGVGCHLAAGTSVRIVGNRRGATPPAPLLGQDTDQILMDVLRLDSAAVGKLHDAGVVAGPDQDPLVGKR
jgi:2-methylfumaryl-CoA isomerase